MLHKPTSIGDAAAPSRRELLLAGVFLLLVGVAAYGWYVVHAGFYGDDWGNAASYRFAQPPRYWSAFRSGASNLGGRPVLAALLPLPHALLGVHPSLHLALAVVLAAGTSLCFYLLLRVLGLDALDAATISALALVFPWADAIELWPTASINTVAVIFFFAAVVLALEGFKRPGWRGIALHSGAGLLYLLSVLTYEVAGATALLAGVLYLRRAPLAQALRRWSVDIVVVLAGLTYSLVRTAPVRHVGTLHQRIADVPEMARQALSLFGWALLPVGRAGRMHMALSVLAAVAVVTLVVCIVRRAHGASNPWLYLGLGCGVAIGAAYFMFLGSGLHPMDPSTGTRTNVLARFAYAGIAYSVVTAATQLAVRDRRLARSLTLAVVAVIAAGYSVRLASDESAWVRAWHLQGKVKAAIDAEFPSLQSGTTVVTFGFPAEVAPRVPIFVATWDLTGAVQLERSDPTLHAFPVYQTVVLHCTPGQLVIHLPGSRGTATARFGELFFLDVATRRTTRVMSSSGCARAVSRFRPGSYFAP